MTADDKRNQKGIENYAAFWDKDSKNDTQAHTENRLNAYTDVVNGYYDGATELYEYGWGTSFHFSRFFKGEGFTASLARHEYYLAAQMSLRPGQKVLDVGCGVGGPARAIARFSDANIIGVNNNDYQLEKARKYTQQQDLQDQVSFQKGDFMSLSKQFGENSFDAVYAIEATVHAPSFEGIYSEIYKVLKPGGTVGIYEWVMTDEWDPTNPEHKDIAHGIEIGDGIAEMRNAKNAHEAFVAAGFEIIVEEDLAARPDAIPWYYPLEGDLRKAQTVYDLLTCFRTSKVGQMITHNVTWGAEKLGHVPKGTYSVGETLRVAGDALVRGGQKKLFTPMYLFIGRKPLDAK